MSWRKFNQKPKKIPSYSKKTLADGRQSLYLEYYMGYNKVLDDKTGKEKIKHIRNKEYLGLYLLQNPRTPEGHQKNKETLALAYEIRTDKERDLITKKHGKVSPVKQKINFLDYFQSYVDSYSKKDIRMMEGSLQRFKDFLADSYPTMKAVIKPEQIDKDMMIKFVEYLQSRSIGEGARGYVQRFKKVIKYATDQDIFLKNPCNGIVCIVDDSALTKEVLTLEEIQQLAKTPYQNMDIRRAFLFCQL